MIWLHSDCLLVQTTAGQTVPCSAEAVILELVGDAASGLDPELMRHAAQGVLHYFKAELQRDSVTVAEFAAALEQALTKLGLQLALPDSKAIQPRVVVMDLHRLAAEASVAFELGFFSRLRDEVRLRLREAPGVLRFKGLRGCVKELSGSRRWNHRCQSLNDQIVDFLRQCWTQEPRTRDTALVVE
jgi:hypothetical protein